MVKLPLSEKTRGICLSLSLFSSDGESGGLGWRREKGQELVCAGG